MPASERIGPAYAAMMSMTSHRDRGLPPATRGYCRTICETTVASPKFRFWNVLDTHGELQAPEDVSDSEDEDDEDEADLHHLITSTGDESDNSDDEE